MNESRFTVIAGVIIDRLVMEDPRLSWKAKGIYTAYCELQQKHDIASPTVTDLQNYNNSGYQVVASGMKELRSLGVIGLPSSPGRPQVEGFIYLAHAKGTNRYKIGLSKAPKRRVKEINDASPIDVEMVCCFPVERMGDAEDRLHQRFSEKRVKGEWFELTADDIAYIKSIGGAA